MFQMYIFRMNVYSGHNLLHQIQEKEFIDSPEFESGVNGDEKYQVTMNQGIHLLPEKYEVTKLRSFFLLT